MIRVLTQDGNHHLLPDISDSSAEAYSSSSNVVSALKAAILAGNYESIEEMFFTETNVSGAYLALINSELFDRIESLAAISLVINLRYTNIVAGLSQGVSGAWLPEVVSVSIERLSEALDQDGESFSQAEEAWLSGWNEQFNLALNFPWTASL